MSAASVATRLARREVMRRPWRSAIVMLLVIAPVVVLTALTVGVRTNDRTHAEKFSAEWGTADIVYPVDSSGEQVAALPPDLDLPVGTTAHPFRHLALRIKTTDLVRSWATITDLRPEGDEASPLLDNVRGEFPAGPGEVLLSAELARVTGLGVGDVLVLERPTEVELTVSGIATWRPDLKRRAILVDGSADSDLIDRISATSPPSTSQILTLPAGAEPSPQLIRQLESGYHPNRFIDPWASGQSTQTTIVWMWVAGAVSFVIVGVVIAAAFAVTARRQLRLIGQLMGNGASASTLRAALFLQGSIIGLVGGIVGVAIALVGLHVGQPLIENALGRRIDAYDVRIGDIAPIVLLATMAATVAAMIPARVAIQTSVLQALAGRRPVGPYPTRLVVRGAMAAVAGLVLLAVATAGAAGAAADQGAGLFALTGIAGAIAVLLGTCAMSPAIIGWLEPLAGRLRGSTRLAARSIARQRSRTGAVVSAVAVVAAGAVAASKVWMTVLEEEMEQQASGLPQDRVVVQSVRWDDQLERTENLPIDDDVIAQILAVIPGATVHPSRIASVPRASATFELPPDADTYPGLGGSFSVVESVGVVEVDPYVRDALATYGLVVPTWSASSSTPDPAVVPSEIILYDDHGDPSALVEAAMVAAEELPWPAGGLITEAKARDLGLVVEYGATTIVAPRDLDEAQFDQLEDLQHDLWSDTAASDASVNLDFSRPRWAPSRALVTGGIVAVATLFVLGVVGLGLALSAAETKDECDVLAAVGARPQTLRRLAATKALVLAGIGMLVGIPLGFIPTYVVAQAGNPGYQVLVVFPWLQVVLLVAAVPLLAAAATLIASGISMRIRPVQASTMAFD